MGLAIADDVMGPYEEHPDNPMAGAARTMGQAFRVAAGEDEADTARVDAYGGKGLDEEEWRVRVEQWRLLQSISG